MTQKPSLSRLTITSVAVGLFSLFLGSAVAQEIETVEIRFSSDPEGYGRALAFPTTRAMFRSKEGEDAEAQVVYGHVATDVDGDGQPEYIVRAEHPALCDEWGCPIFVFRWDEGEERWVTVLNTRTLSIALGPVDEETEKAVFVTEGDFVWYWDGSRYDLREEDFE